MEVMDELRRSIGDFIESTGEEVRSRYNVELLPESIAGELLELDDGTTYLGDWRVEETDDGWEAVYREAITDDEDVDVILELETVDKDLAMKEWSVREFF